MPTTRSDTGGKKRILSIITIQDKKQIELAHIDRRVTNAAENIESMQRATPEAEDMPHTGELKDTHNIEEEGDDEERVEWIILPILKEAIVRSISRFITVTENNISRHNISLGEKHHCLH